AAATSARTSVPTGGRNQTVRTTIGSSTSALRTRIMPSRKERLSTAEFAGGSPPGHRRLFDAAIPSIALLIRENRLEEVLLAEVWPQRIGDPDFSVSNLPEEEVADPHLAARPYQQIRIRLPRRV